MDDNSFRSFELNGWQTVFGYYHKAFGKLTEQAIGPLLDVVAAGPTVRLLDVATGPGYVIAAASQRGTGAVGLDFSTAMVDMAKAQIPSEIFCVGDAESLPFANSSFDAVTMNFAVLHLAHPERALAEAYRVLRSSGRFGFTAWCGPGEAVGFGIVLDALDKYGRSDVPLASGPPFFRFGNPRECKRVLNQVGFEVPKIIRVPQVWRLSDSEELFNFMDQGTVRTRGMLQAQSTEALASIREAVKDRAEAYRKTAGIELPMPAVLASAVKP